LLISRTEKILSAFTSVLLISTFFISTALSASETLGINRYFFSGDGEIRLVSEKNGKSFTGLYRKGRGTYSESAVRKICDVFDAPFAISKPGMSLRLVEFIDYLSDRLAPGARVTITSGYRNPEYNSGIRNRGGLAAKASLHQYGMACDLKIEGVPAKNLWDYVKGLGFGGAGYYQGETVHVDVGPARSWDEKTSGVGTGLSDNNKLIGIVTDYDIYKPGMSVTLRFIRMTAFPIDVNPEFVFIRQYASGESEKALAFSPALAISEKGNCPQFADIDQMAYIQWNLPPETSPGRYKIRARFCGDNWKDMPREIETPEFEIRQ
jgi:uncharacterized protein YcbK (DUF882 family)